MTRQIPRKQPTDVHQYKPRGICRGSRHYERLMREAKQEFDEFELRTKENYKNWRTAVRDPKEL